MPHKLFNNETINEKFNKTFNGTGITSNPFIKYIFFNTEEWFFFILFKSQNIVTYTLLKCTNKIKLAKILRIKYYFPSKYLKIKCNVISAK